MQRAYIRTEDKGRETQGEKGEKPGAHRTASGPHRGWSDLLPPSQAEPGQPPQELVGPA